jgi:hypothetical protein
MESGAAEGAKARRRSRLEASGVCYELMIESTDEDLN